MKFRKLTIAAAGMLTLAVSFIALVRQSSLQPAEIQPENVTCTDSAPLLQAGQMVKIMVWNVQYMAGKNYVFWYDLPDHDGPDERPSPADITQTFADVARVIRAEDPDIVLLQELDVSAARTDYEDQLARLQKLLPDDYVCTTSAFYWQAACVPHPRILGSVGLAMAILSKYRITSAQRHQLALVPNNWLYQQMNTKRAVLAARLPIEHGGEFVVMNTHLEAFAQGSNTMELQVGEIDSLLTGLSDSGLAWVIGGDFNLLPPDSAAYHRLSASQRGYFNPHTEITPLYAAWQAVPSLQEVSSPVYQQWFTHFPNDPEVSAPDRTIDYLFFDRDTKITDHYVRQQDTKHISDHLPIVAEFQLP